MLLNLAKYCGIPLLGLLILIPFILSAQAQSTAEDNLYKFDGGFYEKIQNMQNAQGGGAAGQSSDIMMHSVIIITDEGYEDRTELVLQELGAQNSLGMAHLTGSQH